MGRLVAYVQSIIMVVTMFVNGISYGLVWVKIKQVTKNTQSVGATTRGNNSRAASVMMKFVAAYIFQWCSNVIYFFWSSVEIPPFAAAHFVVFTCNMGGLFNLIAYTSGRKMGAGDKSSKKTTTKADNVSTATQSTVN